MTLHEQQKLLLSYYSPTKAVTNPTDLKGRERELEDALLFLLNGECIIVQGSKRIGKSSFLHCLGTLCTQQGQSCIYVSFQRLSKYDALTFTQHLTREIALQLQLADDVVKTKNAELFGTLRQLGQLLNAKYQTDKYMMVFLDEFQLTENFSEEDRHIFYNQLRDVIEERAIHPELRRFAFVLATSQSLAELCVGISSTLASSFSKTFILSRISASSCRELIQHPLADMIVVDDDTVELLISESGGHPYLLKLLLHNIIVRNLSDISSVQVPLNFRNLAAAQVMTLTEDLNHDHFVMLKNLLNEVEMQILYEIDKHQKLGFLDLRKAILVFLEQFPESVQISSIRPAIDHLQNLQILNKENELFRFANGIYQKWFALFFEQYYVNEAVQALREARLDVALESKSISSTEEFIQVIQNAILSLKTAFEEKGLWELAWKDKSKGFAHHERYLQKMTAALLDSYLTPYNILLEREVESGVGPMDIKLNLNRDLSACLEIKKSSGDVYAGLETEMTAYMGSMIKIGFFVVFYLDRKTRLKTLATRLDEIVQKLSRDYPDKTFKAICIDCTPRQSASKKSRIKSNVK